MNDQTEADRPPGEYRDVPGFPDYQVGSNGTVWSRKVTGSHYGRIGGWKPLRPGNVNLSGHQSVSLCLNGEVHQMLVHRLVLLAFVGPCPEGMEGCHAPDRNPRNNNVTNLRWDTPTGNRADTLAHGTRNHGSRHGLAKLTEETVRSLRAEHAAGTAQSKLARKYGMSRAAVCLIINRKTWRHL